MKKKKGNLGKVIAIFKEIGFKPDLDDPQSVRTTHNIVFLFQQAGVDCGFTFTLDEPVPKATR
jgi:hypothetical protein